MASPQRRPLGFLFALLAAALGAVAAYAVTGEAWVIAVAAGVLCVWMAELSFRFLR